MKQAANTALFAHWQSIRNGRRVPERGDLDPMSIRHVLAYTFMLEVDQGRPGQRGYPVRVSGTRLDALFGRDLKDVPFTALWDMGQQVEIGDLLETVLNEGRPAVVGCMGAPQGYPGVALELLVLPLRCRGRTHARLLCSLSPVHTPSWLGLASIGMLRVTSWRLIDPPAPRPQPARDERTAGLSPRFDPRRRFAVIEGGKSTDAVEHAGIAQDRVKAAVTGSGVRSSSTRCS